MSTSQILRYRTVEMAGDGGAAAVILPFVGGLFGSVIGPPIMEIFKSRLAQKTLWRAQKRELIETLRFIFANIEAFFETRTAVETSVGEDDPLEVYRSALGSFDISLISKHVERIAIFAPDASETSAVAQYLVKDLTILMLLIKSSRNKTGQYDIIIHNEAKEKWQDIKTFVANVYCKSLLLNGIDFLFDKQIIDFKNNLHRKKTARAFADLEKSIAKWAPSEKNSNESD